jgi:Glycoside hydrolase family 44
MKTALLKCVGCFLLFTSFGAGAQTISKNLVGTNVWYSDVSKEVWNLTKECGVTTIRIGGHRYDKKMPSNETLLGWVKNIQAMGAEPVIQMSQYQPPHVAAALVKLFNTEKHSGIKPVKFWSIGNEPWLQANKPSAETFAAVVEAYFKPIAAAMKEVDSAICIYGPNECDYMEYYNDLFGGKNDIAGKVPGHTYYYCDGLSWHRYPQGNGDPATDGASDFLTRIKKAKAKVDAVNLLHNRTGKNALQWGIGEYNSKGGPEVHTWGNGQMFGAVLGYCMEYGATYANTWSMFEHAGDRKGSDFSFIDGAHMTPRASYRHMQLVAKYFTGTFLKGIASADDFLVYGAQDGDQLSIMIMNRGFGEAKPYTLYLNDRTANTTGITLLVKANKEGVFKDSIQPRATQVWVFKGKTITRISYTSNDFDKGLPPVYTRLKNKKIKKSIAVQQ